MKQMTLGIFLIMMLLLTGCVKADFHITVNKDGSVDLNHKFGLNEQMAAFASDGNPIAEMEEDFKNQGFTVKTFKEGGFIGVEGTKHLNSIDELKTTNALGFEGTGENQPTFDLKIDNGFFYGKYDVVGDFDLTSMTEDLNTGDGSEEFTKMFLNQMDMKFSLTLPVEAKQQNASRIIGEENKTYQWDLIPGKKNEIQLQAEVLKVNNIIGIAVAILLIIVLSVWGFSKKTKSESAN